VSDKVRAMAALTDLVVIGLDPAAQALSAEVTAWMRYCTRPVLTVPFVASNFQHAPLAYDGSPKSREALFVAAYLGEQWKTRLTLITINDSGHVDGMALEYARQYLELHELAADYIAASGNAPEQIMRAVRERACDVLLMGSHTYSPLMERCSAARRSTGCCVLPLCLRCVPLGLFHNLLFTSVEHLRDHHARCSCVGNPQKRSHSSCCAY
jgi:nucleotide-binding universal stress UspA family protein